MVQERVPFFLERPAIASAGVVCWVLETANFWKAGLESFLLFLSRPNSRTHSAARERQGSTETPERQSAAMLGRLVMACCSS